MQYIPDILSWACVIVTLASGICAVTPTPAPGTKLATVYAWVEKIALIVGYAKDRGIVKLTPSQENIVAMEKDVLKK